MFTTSDTLAFANKTKKILFLPDTSFALLKADILELYNFTGKPLPIRVQERDIDFQKNEKNGTCSKKFMNSATLLENRIIFTFN
jgi:glucosamine 6-phosphate synthetase-like amidotransferase/phosphosugar isomerase protein